MNFRHDVHDWLGGFPYESAQTNAVVQFVEEKGSELEKKICKRPKLFGQFWPGCDEFVFTRNTL